MTFSLTQAESCLALLKQWADLGWLRPLDYAFAEFIQQLEPEADGLTLLASALVSFQLSRGHICLDLQQSLAQANFALALDEQAKFVKAEEQDLLPTSQLKNITLSQWQQSLQASTCVALATQLETNAPLVLADNYLYLRRYWDYEQSVIRKLEARLDAQPATDTELVTRLNTLFTASQSATTDWQKVACALAARNNFTIITGGPGTGKTTTVVRLLALLQEQAANSLRIRLAAPTGKAAARLTESISKQVQALPVDDQVKAAIPCEVSTLHRLLGSLPNTRHFRHHQGNPLALDVLVIDEASMIDLDMMNSLLTALPDTAKLILLGDKDQLASVEAGAVLGDLCQTAEPAFYSAQTVQWLEATSEQPIQGIQQADNAHALAQHIAMLRYSRRFNQNSGIAQLATAVNQKDRAQAEKILQQGYSDLSQLQISSADDGALKKLVLEGVSAHAKGYRYYLERLINLRPAADCRDWTAYELWAGQILEDFDQFQMLCAVRAGQYGVENLNLKISQWLKQANLTNHDQGWFEGRPVIITRNDYSLGLMNGDIGITLRVPSVNAERTQLDPAQMKLRVVFAKNDGKGGLRFILPSRLSHFESVFAMTVHKSQGSEFAHTALVLPDRQNPVLTKELIYTAITRAQQQFTLVETANYVFSEAVRAEVTRLSGLKKRFSHKSAIH